MPRNAAIEAVLAQEAQDRLWFRDVLGYPVWSLERLGAYRREVLRGDPVAASASSRGAGSARVEAEWRAIRASARDLLIGGGPAARTAAGRDLWVLSSSGYRRRVDGAWRCIFADHLVRQLGDRLLFLEWNTARLPSLEQDDVCFLDAIQAPLLGASRLLGGPIGAALGMRASRGTRDFGGVPPARVADRAVYGRVLLALARRWMDVAPPRAVFVLCGYTMHGPVQLAARERAIPVIELQHGIVHESHAGYVLPALPASRLGRLPTPDHLVLFGDYFGRVLERESPRWRGRWSVGGHPWLRARRAEAGAGATATSSLVLFSQYELDTRIAIRAAAIAARAALPTGWRVIVKPHPRETDAVEFFVSAVAQGVVLASPADDSYRLMADAAVVATVYSTLCIEALAFSCRSVVFPSARWTEAIADLVVSGQLECVPDGESLAALALDGSTAGSRVGGGAADALDAGMSRAAIAQDLFGIGLPELDFAAVLAGALKR